MKQIMSYLKDYRFNSILIKNFGLLLVCLMIPVLVLTWLFGNEQQMNLFHEIQSNNESSLELSKNNVNSAIASMKNMAYSLSVSGDIQYLNTKSSVRTDAPEKLENVQNILSLINAANPYVDSIYIYFAKTEELINRKGCQNCDEYGDMEWLKLYAQEMANRTVFQVRQKNGKYPYLLTILQPVQSQAKENMGAVIVNIDMEKLGDYIGSGNYRNTNNSPMLFIFDKNTRKLVYSDEYRLFRAYEEIEVLAQMEVMEEITSEVHELWEKPYMVSCIASEQDDFDYFYLSPMDQFDEQRQTVTWMILRTGIWVALSCLILACFMAVWVYRPVRNTIGLLKELTMMTKWDKKAHWDEMEVIRRSILSAREEQYNLNEKIQARAILLHNAQIYALQTQINPHFLYNTLESIGNAAALLMEGENDVTDMIYSLGLLMRTSLSGGNYLVSVEEELEHIGLYAKLVDFRFHKKITLHIEIPEEMKQGKIVKLTLQPLIENAIEHGFSHKRREGNIWVRGKEDGERKYLYVCDDGEGLPKEKMAALQTQLKESSINEDCHIGLKNVNQRIRLVFGEEYGLRLAPAKEGGLCVIVCYR